MNWQSPKKRHFEARQDDGALQITIATTLACNLACGYCAEPYKRGVRLNREGRK